MPIFILRARKEIKRTLTETPHENLDATTEEFQIHGCSNFGSVNCIRIHHNLPSWAKTEQHRGNETRQPTLPHKKDLPHILCSCDEGSLLAQRGRSKSCSLHQPAATRAVSVGRVPLGKSARHSWGKRAEGPAASPAGRRKARPRRCSRGGRSVCGSADVGERLIRGRS